MSNNVVNTIFTIFGLPYIRIPFLIQKKRFKSRIVGFICIEILTCLCSSYFSSYFLRHTSHLQLWVSLSILIPTYLDLPLLYQGTLFRQPMIREVKTYLLLVFEVAITSLFFSIFFLFNHFWVIFCVSCWRFLILYEPYAFWSSLHSFLSPFAAIRMSKSARSLLIIYLLQMELLLIIFCTIWHMEKNAYNSVIAYLFACYFAVFELYNLIVSIKPCTNRVIPIGWAKDEETNAFNPAIL